MDKRIENSIEKIYQGFSESLKHKKYEDVIIEDIIKYSGVSRSTFYSHYKNKEELLSSICKSIFDHVFSHSLKEEKTHDFSKTSIFDYRHLVTHVLYHLSDEEELIKQILSSSASILFLREMKSYVFPVAKACLEMGLTSKKKVPDMLRISSIRDNFITSVEYWFNDDCHESPEAITDYFFALIQ